MKKLTLFLIIGLLYGQGAQGSQNNQEIVNGAVDQSASCLGLAAKTVKTCLSKIINNTASSVGGYYQNTTATGLLKDMALTYGIGMGITAAHELGHALMATLLYGKPLHINIGGYNHDGHLFKIPCITVRGLNPAIGYTEGARNGTPWKDLIVSLMGPVFGMAASYASYKLISANAKESTLPLAKLVSLFAIYNNCLPQLLPKGNNDGAHALSSLNQIMKKNSN